MDWIYWIIIGFFVLSLVSMAVTAYRYRQYLQSGWFMFKAYRQMKKMNKPSEKTFENKPAPNDSPLINCAKCQKWFPQDQAIKLKTNFFCSHNCLEASFSMKK